MHRAGRLRRTMAAVAITMMAAGARQPARPAGPVRRGPQTHSNDDAGTLRSSPPPPGPKPTPEAPLDPH